MANICEAKITVRGIDPGSTRYLWDLEGRKIDQGPDTPERAASAEATINCLSCSLTLSLTAAGGPPYGAINEARRRAGQDLRDRCLKWQELKGALTQREKRIFF